MNGGKCEMARRQSAEQIGSVKGGQAISKRKGGSLSTAALLVKNLGNRYATAAVKRRRRIAVPIKPKPAISIAQLAGSGTADSTVAV